MDFFEKVEKTVEEMPGWTVVALFFMLVVLIIGGRILDIYETTTAGVEKMIDEHTDIVLPRLGYRDVARFVWESFTYLFTALFSVIVAVKVSSALRRED